MPLLKEIVRRGLTRFDISFPSWEEATRASCQPLIKAGYVTKDYEDAIIDCVKKYGPYIVLAPNIAMPHAMVGVKGVNKTAIGFMKVEEPVHFKEGDSDKDATLFFVLAAKDSDEHMANMSRLATMLTNPDVVRELLSAKSDGELLRIDEKYPDN